MLQFTKYSPYDELIILKASALGMPLIGGTALEVLDGAYGKSGVRKRSDNDLDFTTNSDKAKDALQQWVKANVDTDKVQVDVYLVKSHILPKQLIKNANGVLVLEPEYIIWSKLQRLSEQDKKDIKWLLTIADASKLEFWLETLEITDAEVGHINELIQEVSDTKVC